MQVFVSYESHAEAKFGLAAEKQLNVKIAQSEKPYAHCMQHVPTHTANPILPATSTGTQQLTRSSVKCKKKETQRSAWLVDCKFLLSVQNASSHVFRSG